MKMFFISVWHLDGHLVLALKIKFEIALKTALPLSVHKPLVKSVGFKMQKKICRFVFLSNKTGIYRTGVT